MMLVGEAVDLFLRRKALDCRPAPLKDYRRDLCALPGDFTAWPLTDLTRNLWAETPAPTA